MRLLIASDLHGSADATEKLMRQAKAFGADRIILLGDILYHGPRNDIPQGYAPKKVIPQLNAVAEKITAVRGNCDAEVDQMVLDFDCRADYLVIAADKHVMALTHGHVFGPDKVPPVMGLGVLMSGHTHVKVLEKRADGLVLLNPGSTTIPKDGSASYATYAEGVLQLHLLETGEVIKELKL